MDNEISGLLTCVEQLKAQISLLDSLATDRNELLLGEDELLGLSIYYASITDRLSKLESKLVSLRFGSAQKESPLPVHPCSADDQITVDQEN